MQIEEAKRILEMEDENLPLPKNMLTTNKEEQKSFKALVNSIDVAFDESFKQKAIQVLRKGLKEKGVSEFKIDALCDDAGINLLVKSGIKRNPLVEDLSGKGTIDEPFIIKTKYGEGKFFDGRFCFKNAKWLQNLKPNKCFYNSRLIADKMQDAGFKTKQLTGIDFVGDTYLHSVALLIVEDGDVRKEVIFDANHHLVMEYDLYMKLFSFEVLNEIDGKDISEGKEYIEKYEEQCKENNEELHYALIALSYNEIVEEVKSKLKFSTTNSDLPPV